MNLMEFETIWNHTKLRITKTRISITIETGHDLDKFLTRSLIVAIMIYKPDSNFYF